jgi:hypothetical protein
MSCQRVSTDMLSAYNIVEYAVSDLTQTEAAREEYNFR